MALPPAINTDYYPANWYGERGGHPIVAIIAHATVGTDSRKYLQRGGRNPDGSDRKVSIHVLIDKQGVIYRMVDDRYAANHAGYGVLKLNGKQYSQNGINLNLVTLGFELENLDNAKDPYPDVQLLSMGWQISLWRRLYGPLPIYRHTEVDPPPRKFDTRALTTAQINKWAERAATSSTPYGPYLVRGLPIYNDSQLTIPSGRYARPGDTLMIDRIATDQPKDYAPSAAHVSDSQGGGFVDLNGAVKNT